MSDSGVVLPASLSMMLLLSVNSNIRECCFGPASFPFRSDQPAPPTCPRQILAGNSKPGGASSTLSAHCCLLRGAVSN